MLRTIDHGDVTELRFSTRWSRAIGYRVSAFHTRGVLVDTGFPHVLRDLQAWTRTAQVDGAIVTHSHEDHAGNVVWLARRGVPIAVAPETERQLRAPEPIGWYRRSCWGSAPSLDTELVPLSHPALALIPARGHSPDHHVVWDEERETLYSADLFISVKLRSAQRDEDIRGQVATLRAAIELRPRRVFDAHRGMLERPVDDLRAKADWLESVIGEIERGAEAGWSERRIRDEVLGPEDFTGWVSFGDYSRMNFVRSVLGKRPNS